jgi:putative tryptophan/tyrosine transport system substrate-binding protein
MRRRKFVGGLLLAATTMGQARAEAAKTYRIAIFDPITPAEVMNEAAGPQYPLWGPLFTELRRMGYAEGKNLTVERYGIKEYSPDLARKVVAGHPDVIFANQSRAVHDLMTATKTIPIVGLFGFDPVRAGLVSNFARPGGNFTGVSVNTGHNLSEKPLEQLREMIPSMSKVGLLATRFTWENTFRAPVEQASKTLGVTVVGPFLEVPITSAAIRQVFAAMSKEHIDAVYVTSDVWRDMPLVIELAQEFRLPATYPNSYFAKIGGLMAIDVDIPQLGGVVADQMGQILKGTKPGDIPIYQIEKFTLTINMKTAKALGLTVPASLLARADEVIE